MYAVLHDTCGGNGKKTTTTSHTYLIDRKSVSYLGPQDSHEKEFNYLGEQREFELSEEEEEEEEEDEDRRHLSEEEEENSICEVC